MRFSMVDGTPTLIVVATYSDLHKEGWDLYMGNYLSFNEITKIINSTDEFNFSVGKTFFS